MGCGASRSSPVAETLVFYKRVEKERDDASMEVVQLKRLGVEHFDSFFADVEDAVNDVVKLNNAYQDALCDARAALVEAISVEPARALAVEVATHGVRATPQLLLDVVYSDNGVRPSPKEVRHMLSARPAVAEADAAVARAVADLYSALAVPAVPVVRLTYNHEKHHLNAVPMSGATTSAPGAHGRLQKLHQAVASFNAAVTGLRKAAPGLRLRVEVVPCPAFHARTYAWRLLPREEALAAAAAREGAGGDTGGTSAAATPGGTQPAPRPYTPKPPVPPLQIAACHNAGAILEAAALVAHQAAAVAAATGSLPFTELHTRSGRRVIAASQPDAAAAAAAAAAVAAAASSATAPVSPTKRLGSVLGGMRHSISAFRTSVTGAPPDLNGHGTTVTTHGRTLSGGGALSGAFPGPNASPIAGVGAAAAGDEAMASLRRAITGANHALFRLSKLAAAAGTAPPPPAWLAGGRPGDGAVSVLAPAARFILESAVGAARAAAAVAAVVPGVTSFLKREATSRLSSDGLMTPRAASTAFTDGDGGGGGGGGAGGGGGGGAGGGGGGAAAAARMPASDLVTLEPRVTIASEHGSVIDSTYSNTFSGGITGQALNAVAEGLTPGWSWNWEWGIETQVVGTAFPDCLPPRARAVLDRFNEAVDAARNATEQIPLLQREVNSLVDEAEGVFDGHDEQLCRAATDMMSAGRARAAFDRNANTISASPALVGLLHAAVSRLLEELRRCAEEMRTALYDQDRAAAAAADAAAAGGGVGGSRPSPRGGGDGGGGGGGTARGSANGAGADGEGQGRRRTEMSEGSPMAGGGGGAAAQSMSDELTAAAVVAASVQRQGAFSVLGNGGGGGGGGGGNASPMPGEARNLNRSLSKAKSARSLGASMRLTANGPSNPPSPQLRGSPTAPLALPDPSFPADAASDGDASGGAGSGGAGGGAGRLPLNAPSPLGFGRSSLPPLLVGGSGGHGLADSGRGRPPAEPGLASRRGTLPPLPAPGRGLSTNTQQSDMSLG